MLEFKDFTDRAKDFFEILPEDWVVEIEPLWDDYDNTAKIYCIIDESTVVSGGIVFSTVSPDTKGYKEIAQSWLTRGYLYIAFLYVSENHRGRGLGSFWYRELKKLDPQQKFWLAIEEKNLMDFYVPLGFFEQAKVLNNGTEEWILADSIN